MLDELTDREREVLVLVARGMSNGDIAGHLFLSEGTVKTHTKRIFAKLGLHDRTQAAILAYEVGLVRPGEALPQVTAAPAATPAGVRGRSSRSPREAVPIPARG